jgi:DNA modification methylase
MSDNKEIKISAAKGRPMLSWVGKRPLRHVTPFPAQHVESFSVDDERKLDEGTWEEWPDVYPKGGLLFHGDNKEVLAHLLANGFRGLVKLIYIDPPFDSGADYVRKVQLRGRVATTKIEGESYNLGEQIQYTDIWANDNYLQFMYERLMLLKELLADDGSLYLHCDTHRTHHLRCLLEEVFGTENLRNEVIWQRFNFRADGKKFGTVHDTIYLVTKSDKYLFEKPYVELKPSYIKTHFRQGKDGRFFQLDNLTAPSHGKPGKPLKFGDTVIAPPQGTMWRFAQEGIDDLWEKEKIVIPDGGVPRIKRYLDEIEGQAVHSIWTDVRSINSQSNERTDYDTQKPEEMVARIIETSSNLGDLVLDCFIGSGTTAAVAQKLGRRWIGCDINKGAIQTTSKRLLSIIEGQSEILENAPTDMYTPEKHEGHKEAKEFDGECSLCLSELANFFTLWRVNDYDLKIQRNEAIKLACEHIGIERIPSDSYFEGKLGKKLVKIIAFEHPLSPLDLEELKRELDARPELTSTIVFVCLGIELAARTWIDDWNRLLKGEHTVNKIEVIELRTDAKYGNFIKHEPATGKVSITREEDKIKVTIDDFISPTILKRLDMDMPVFKAKITDWRSQVDCVMIDTEYDGKVFHVVLSDVPVKKTDLIDGLYVLPAPTGSANVAVKIIDMLGEEVLITAKV